MTDSKRELLRHTVATLAYRGGKALRGAPANFPTFRLGDTTRTPIEILAHVGDLLDWMLHLLKGQHVWKSSGPGVWEVEVARFFELLGQVDEHLALEEPLKTPPEKLFQGPIADAFTHVGQISILRRLAGSPVRGENYFKADIAIGRVGSDQPAARVEFD
jgi:hypothetical protein